jgi:hypothetical protein
MFRKLLAFTLAGLLTTAITSVPISAQTQATAQLTHAEKVKVRVMRIGVGRARVSVKLRNHMKLKGYIGQIEDNGFSLIDPKSGTVTPVPYGEVLEVKNINRSALLRMGIATGAIVGLMVLILLGARGA